MSWHSDTSSSTSTNTGYYYVYSGPLKKWKAKTEKKVEEEEIKQMSTDQILFDPKDLRL